jgi:hypothetical protein
MILSSHVMLPQQGMTMLIRPERRLDRWCDYRFAFFQC